MAMLLPPLVYEAPQVAPATGGLYGAANVVTQAGPARLVGGLQFIPTNCGGAHGHLPIECPPEEPINIEGDGPGLGDVFPATTVYAADECGLLRSEQVARDRALHMLELYERVDVEQHVADLLAERVTDVRTAAGEKEIDRIAQAVAIAESELGALGLTGVIHAPAGAAVAAQRAGVIRWQSNVPLTPLGHRWAFGGGYDTMVNRLYVTGPVTLVRTDVTTYPGLGARKNQRLIVAQRDIAVAWECLALALDYGTVV